MPREQVQQCLETFSVSNLLIIIIFVQLGFNLSNRVTDTLESSTILIYMETRMSLYAQKCG